MDDIKRILVVSRMTTYCWKAVHYGISLAKKYGAELYFVHCTHDPFVFEWPPSVPLWVIAEDYKKLLVKNKEDIDTIINVEKEKGLKITELIKDVDPVEVISEAVKNENIDLLIMAAHEEGRRIIPLGLRDGTCRPSNGTSGYCSKKARKISTPRSTQSGQWG